MLGLSRRSVLRTAAVASALAAGCTGRRTDALDSDSPPRTERRSTPPSESTPSPTETTSTPYPDVRTSNYDFAPLSFGDWPQASTDCRGRRDLAERTSLVTFEYSGQEGRHIVQSARRLLGILGCYRESSEGQFLDAAVELADALLDVAVRRDGAYFYPYGFDYRTGTHDYDAPWYSGMAQGIALSAFVRLHRHTGERRYRDAADATFASLARFRDDVDDGDPWVSLVQGGYYWIEEYPDDPPNHTLNGMNFAIWGLYEYWRATGDPAAERLLDAAVTTIAEHINLYRVEGDLSYYCLGHRAQSKRYHEIHIAQLKQLHRLSGDKRFKRAATAFRADA